MKHTTTELTRHLRASRSRVYRALIDPVAIARWRVPEGMTARVHAFEAREGGAFRITLTYVAPTDTGKTTAQSDTYHGHFVRLVPDELVVESIVFESDQPGMQGEMTVTITLSDLPGGAGTRLHAVHENLPPAVSPTDNALGWSMALEKLKRLVEVG